MTSSAELRRRVRNARRGLSEQQRRESSLQVAQRVRSLEAFRHARCIAAFLAFDGELDPQSLVKEAWTQGKRVYLPIIGRDEVLRFGRYGPETPLVPNRFRIPEPAVGAEHMIEACELELVLTPLVAFDGDAHRMGMGGGYYDRSFAFVRDGTQVRRPTMLGIAYELQKQAAIQTQPWDVPLDGVATEMHLYPRPGQSLIR